MIFDALKKEAGRKFHILIQAEVIFCLFMAPFSSPGEEAIRRLAVKLRRFLKTQSVCVRVSFQLFSYYRHIGFSCFYSLHFLPVSPPARLQPGTITPSLLLPSSLQFCPGLFFLFCFNFISRSHFFFNLCLLCCAHNESVAPGAGESLVKTDPLPDV